MIIHADILQWAEEYRGEPFHALLCDPPYHLTEVVRRFGSPDAAPPKGDVYARSARGFMGKTWDGGDVAYRPETWAALAQHLHPGAFGMAFASSRGWHRMAVAIEDAGLLIHPTIFCWGYGSGFPKATRIDTQVDRRAGVERTKVGQRKHQPKFAAAELGYREKDNGYNSKDRESFDVTAPATELAQTWEGHRYGGQALKPAIEPIIVFQRPYVGQPVECITRTGAGGLWIDGGRIRTDEDTSRAPTVPNGPVRFGYSEGGMRGRGHPAGRWPANLVLSHHPQCNGACVPDCPVAALDAQSGERPAGSTIRGDEPSKPTTHTYNEGLNRVPSASYDDSGGASRFFYQSHWAYEIEERIAATEPMRYCAKADRNEREAGLDPRQIALLGMPEAQGADAERIGALRDGDRGTINDGRPTPIDNPYQRGETTRYNVHPTIKPIALCRWLATLLLPPDRYAPRRLLVPFAGAGSEAIGAMLAGWEAIVGVELEEHHVAIAEARLAYWRQRRHEFGDPSKAVTATLSKQATNGQMDMFGEQALKGDE